MVPSVLHTLQESHYKISRCLEQCSRRVYNGFSGVLNPRTRMELRMILPSSPTAGVKGFDKEGDSEDSNWSHEEVVTSWLRDSNFVRERCASRRISSAFASLYSRRQLASPIPPCSAKWYLHQQPRRHRGIGAWIVDIISRRGLYSFRRRGRSCEVLDGNSSIDFVVELSFPFHEDPVFVPVFNRAFILKLSSVPFQFAADLSSQSRTIS